MTNLTPEDYADLDYIIFKDLNESRRPIAEVFTTVRTKLGYTQEQMAAVIGMNRMSLSNIESGKTNRPTNDTLHLLVQFAAAQGAYLSFEMLLRSASMGNIFTVTAGEDLWFDDFAKWYIAQPADLRVVMRFILEAVKRLVEYFYQHYT